MSRIKAFTTSRSPSDFGAEIDLRGELNRMYFGSSQEIAKAHPLLLRRARRNSDNTLVACPCVDELTREPDIDHPCPLCGPYGDGWLWDEEWVEARKVFIRPSNTGFVSRDNWLDVGVANVQATIFYFEYSVTPTLDDRVVEIALDIEGDPIIPYVRNRIYRPETVDGHRSDNGRVEFYSMHCMQKDSIEIPGSPPNVY
jgi:hypothetical protein